MQSTSFRKFKKPIPVHTSKRTRQGMFYDRNKWSITNKFWEMMMMKSVSSSSSSSS